MKADKPLTERQQTEAEDQRALRASLVGRYTEVLDQQHAIEGVHVAVDIRRPAFRAMAERLRG